MRPALARLNELAAAVATPLQSLLLLALRLHVSWQFLKSGLVKLEDWDTTLLLFREEYHVPLLSPGAAAVLGATGEVLFPTLLSLGLLSRYAALGLSFVNVVAVVSYAHVLYAAGYEAALAQHVLWGTVLLVLVVFGSGRFSVDALIDTRVPAEKSPRGR